MSEAQVIVAIRCECGQVAKLTMSVEAALVHARDVESAARGLQPVELQVRGEG